MMEHQVPCSKSCFSLWLVSTENCMLFCGSAFFLQQVSPAFLSLYQLVILSKYFFPFSSVCLYIILRPVLLRIPHTNTVINIFHDDFSQRKRRDKASIFLLFVNQTEAASNPPPSTEKVRGGTESIPSVGCFTVVLLIS